MISVPYLEEIVNVPVVLSWQMLALQEVPNSVKPILALR